MQENSLSSYGTANHSCALVGSATLTVLEKNVLKKDTAARNFAGMVTDTAERKGMLPDCD